MSVVSNADNEGRLVRLEASGDDLTKEGRRAFFYRPDSALFSGETGGAASDEQGARETKGKGLGEGETGSGGEVSIEGEARLKRERSVVGHLSVAGISVGDFLDESDEASERFILRGVHLNEEKLNYYGRKEGLQKEQ